MGVAYNESILYIPTRMCSVSVCAQMRAEFLRDDVQQDQDQLSILSGVTMTRADQMALDSEDESDQNSEYGYADTS